MLVRMCIFHAVVLLCLYEFHTWASDYSKGVHVCMDESVLTNEVHVRTYQSRSPYSDTCHCACMFLCIVVMIAWEPGVDKDLLLMGTYTELCSFTIVDQSHRSIGSALITCTQLVSV